MLAAMGRTTRNQQVLYLDHDKAALLDKLHVETRIAKQVLLREAVDNLLVKYKLLEPRKKKP
jgi:hypothetical protein